MFTNLMNWPKFNRILVASQRQYIIRILQLRIAAKDIKIIANNRVDYNFLKVRTLPFATCTTHPLLN